MSTRSSLPGRVVTCVLLAIGRRRRRQQWAENAKREARCTKNCLAQTTHQTRCPAWKCPPHSQTPAAAVRAAVTTS